MPNENELERTMKEIEQTGPPSSKPPTEADQQAVEVYESGGSFASIAAAIRAAERRGIERAAVVAKREITPYCEAQRKAHENNEDVDRYWLGWDDAAETVAEAIRALEV